ncbi:S-layer homology domain-containing protein [Paenibacillus sp. HWE-109]|uniref:S-layer homology domain-containing protein n=1 Tax=Paenibacillus sp. HWE-109 TaxID=1306526 RepID=UPI001EE0C5AE|nr:S-layer homology domain-containing protein [Paenibacillus sp. HWE-109]UKS26338.1 S-layer homology domain-containing protein [Paenibacillus sp. HWE-109]
MKKLTMIATAAMAFSLFASATLSNPAAAAAKTSADFTDLSNTDAALKAKIDAMLVEGIFDGVSDNSFGINQNMTRAQFAKVATLIYDIKVDPTVKVSSFSDVHANDAANGWAIPYIEAAKKAGLIDGVTDTTFVPGDSVTTGQLDTLLLKGLGKKVSTTGSPWYSDAVKQASDLGIHPAGKTGEQLAIRADLVQSSYTAQQAFDKQNLVSITKAAAASDTKSVQVTLNRSVDTTKATLVLKNGTTVVPTKAVWSTDAQSVTLTADLALAAGDYTVTLGGLDASAIQTGTASFKVAAAPSDSGNISIVGTYTLAAVLDSGLTAAATGSNGLADKATAEDPTLSKFAKEIEIKVKDASGDTVAVPGIIQSIHSSDPSIVKTGLNATTHRGYVLGNKVGTADVSVLVQIGNGDAKQLHVTVTVTKDSITAKEIKAGTTTIDKTLALVGSNYETTFDAYTAMDLSITDNYGITYKNSEIPKYNFALGTLFITNDVKGNAADGAVGTVTVTDGSVHVVGNVTYFELTAVTASGQKVTSYVNLKH